MKCTDVCLSPKLGLQTQLTRSFTFCASTTLALIILIITIVVVSLGDETQQRSAEALQKQIEANIGNASLETAMLVQQDMSNYEMMVSSPAQPPRQLAALCRTAGGLCAVSVLALDQSSHCINPLPPRPLTRPTALLVSAPQPPPLYFSTGPRFTAYDSLTNNS